MQFAAGYQYRSSGELFSEMVADYTSAIAEVYFAPPGFASGRPDAAQDKADALDQLIYELKALRSMNIKLDMLLNGNCYGDNAIAVAFRNRIVEMLEWFAAENLLPEVITTASPFVAHTIKKYFCNIEVRASVNMRIDSLTALEYLQEKFDSFYLRRDLQRDIPTVAMFARWSKLHGKKLCLLANSGCLRNCPYQTFHDNLEDNRYYRDAESAVHRCMHMTQAYDYNWVLNTGVGHEWASGITFWYGEEFFQITELAECVLSMKAWFETAAENLKATLANESTTGMRKELAA